MPVSNPSPSGQTIQGSSHRSRFLTIASAVGQIYAGYKGLQLLARAIGDERVEPLYRRHHRRSAELAYRTATRLQGLMIKSCQFLGTRADILPEEYIEILSTLHDRVPARPYATIAAVVEEDLGCPLRDVFLHFETKPLASASLAQVHRARLHNGREVAVKVQYPGIAELVEIDIANLSFLINLLARIERNFDLRLIIREVSKYVRLELDFANEARNAQIIRANLRHRLDVVIPEIIPELCRRRVLVMDYVPGIKITDVAALEAAGIDKQEVARILSEIFCHQILVDGFFHGDPHPGNLLVQEGPKIVLLDFGLAKDFPPGFVSGMAKLASAIITQDTPALAAAFAELGFRTKNNDTGTLVALGEAFLGQALRSGKAYADAALMDTFNNELPKVLRANPIVEAPSDILLVVRVMGLLSGIGKQLDSQVDPMGVILPFLMMSSPNGAAGDNPPVAAEPTL